MTATATIRKVEALASLALDEADDRVYEAGELLGEKLDAATDYGFVAWASDYSTTVVVHGDQFDVEWFTRLGPRLSPMETGR